MADLGDQAELFGAALLAAGPAAAQEKVLRIAMTAADIPRTLGQPDQGFEGNRFVGLTLFDALTMWDLSSAEKPSVIIPGLAWLAAVRLANPVYGVVVAAGDHALGLVERRGDVVVLERAAMVAEDRFGGAELDGLADLFLDRGLAATSDGLAFRTSMPSLPPWGIASNAFVAKFQNTCFI